MTIRCVRIAGWIPKATNIHSEFVIIIDFPLLQWLHERASILRYTYMPVFFFFPPFLCFLHCLQFSLGRLQYRQSHVYNVLIFISRYLM